MRRPPLLAALAAALLGAASCIDVPDHVRAQFAAPAPSERSNFRPGAHGNAPPSEDPAPTAPVVAIDGGVS